MLPHSRGRAAQLPASPLRAPSLHGRQEGGPGSTSPVSQARAPLQPPWGSRPVPGHGRKGGRRPGSSLPAARGGSPALPPAVSAKRRSAALSPRSLTPGRGTAQMPAGGGVGLGPCPRPSLSTGDTRHDAAPLGSVSPTGHGRGRRSGPAGPLGVFPPSLCPRGTRGRGGGSGSEGPWRSCRHTWKWAERAGEGARCWRRGAPSCSDCGASHSGEPG